VPVDPTNVEFDAARWAKAGATQEQLEELETSFTEQPDADRAGFNAWMASVSDSDLFDWLNGPLTIQELEQEVEKAKADVENAVKGEIRDAKRALKAAETALEEALASQEPEDDESSSDDSAGAQAKAEPHYVAPYGGQEPSTEEE
jgi:hypothetical protein